MGWAQHSAAIPAPQEQRTGLEKKMELVRCCYVAMLLFHGPMRRLGGFIVAGRWVLLYALWLWASFFLLWGCSEGCCPCRFWGVVREWVFLGGLDGGYACGF